ncbi:MAG: metallophosphoesterase family protein [Clostridiales bacterium]|nr:metallophosphoesterase family protein [Clostridiales bacterium]
MIGIISDTHGLLRPEVMEVLRGCDVILHGGDINRQDIINQLEEIAPVYVVRGNNDKDWAEHIPMFLDFELAGLRVYMTHKKKDLPDDLGDYDLVVFGHSHKYEERRQGKTLLLNPGSCGPRRFHQAITMATAVIEEGGITVTRIEIPQKHSGVLSGSGTADLKKQIEIVIRETQKNRSPAAIADRYGFDTALTEQIARLYLTHPGVDADGIMTKMGY